MTVIHRLDALLEPTKKAVVEMKGRLDQAGVTNQDPALRQAAGQSFHNTSPFTLRDLKARARQQQLKSDFESYLDGFAQRAGDSGQVQVPESDSHTGGSRWLVQYLANRYTSTALNLPYLFLPNSPPLC